MIFPVYTTAIIFVAAAPNADGFMPVAPMMLVDPAVYYETAHNAVTSAGTDELTEQSVEPGTGQSAGQPTGETQGETQGEPVPEPIFDPMPEPMPEPPAGLDVMPIDEIPVDPVSIDESQLEGDVITVTGRVAVPEDPLAKINTQTFAIVQSVDEAVVAPVALAYGDAVPKPARNGIRNFFRNLGEPIAFLNFMLQLKPGKAVETLGRFATNSTLGVAGLFDVAKQKPFNLPRRPNGFANTLGYYGVKPGAYLYLPLIGSTTVRDLFGGGIDLFILPVAVGKPFNDPAYAIPAGVLTGLGSRVDANDEIRRLRDETNDPYLAYREFYLQKRQREIDVLRGKLPDPLAPMRRTNDVKVTPDTTTGAGEPASPTGYFDDPK